MRALVAGVLGALLLGATVQAVSIEDDGCLKCHRLRGLSTVTKENVVKDCSINDALYAHSVHRNVGCTECHDRVEQYPHRRENTAPNCANECHIADPSTKRPFSHEEIVETWKESVHGRNYDKAPNLYPDCNYCHVNSILARPESLELLKKTLGECSVCHEGEEWIKDRLSHVAFKGEVPVGKNGFVFKTLKGRRDGWEVVELCASCHGDEEKMEKALEIEGIEDEYMREHILKAVESYKVTMHAKMLYLDRTDTRAADCLDCHTNSDGNYHDIFTADDTRSSIHPARIAKTCGRSSECHPMASAMNMKNFAVTKWVHMYPLPENLGQKIVWIVEWVFKVLVTVVLLFASGVVILDLLRNLRK